MHHCSTTLVMQSLVTTNLQTAPDPGQRFGMSSRGHHANGDQREWRGNNGPRCKKRHTRHVLQKPR